MGHPSGPELLEGSRCINLSNTMAGVISMSVSDVIILSLLSWKLGMNEQSSLVNTLGKSY